MAEEIDLFHPSLEELQSPCQDALPALAVKGLEAFNAGEFFEAHEFLETAWRAERRPVRELYRGVLQVAVGYFHICQNNYVGARKMFARSRKWLAPFPAICQGIQLDRLRQDLDLVEAALVRLGPAHIADFDRALFKPVAYLHE